MLKEKILKMYMYTALWMEEILGPASGESYISELEEKMKEEGYGEYLPLVK